MKSGFSFLGLIFNSAYYAGKGNVKKGTVLAALALVPVFGTVGVPLYCGFKANEEVGSNEFSWKRAIVFCIVFAFVASAVIKGIKIAVK